MREHRLLDRIRLMARNPQRRITEEPAQMIRSIQRHLQRILNTRQGNTLIAEDFGVPDFTNFMSSFPDSRSSVERQLRQTIQKYEPRLRGVRVRFSPREDDPLSVSFQITAQLILKSHHAPVAFESLVDSSGHVRLKSS
jgi:type VI secretion system protein